MSVTNSFISLISQGRLKEIDYFRLNPEEVQERVLKELLKEGSNSEYGRLNRFADIRSVEQFQNRVPVMSYTELDPWSQRLMQGEKQLLWPGKVTWFARSSGSTEMRSKFIPVTEDAIAKIHFMGARDVMMLYNYNYPQGKGFDGKTLVLGGSTKISLNPTGNIRIGDVSAIQIANAPGWTRLKKTPSPEIMLMTDWDTKIIKVVEATLKENVTAFAGVPSWFLLLIKRVIEESGKKTLNEVWPNLELFMHGGISFIPYRKIYEELIPNPLMKYMETYNASEGFFSIQDDPADTSMLLMLDYQMFYEFIPMSEWGKERPSVIPLADVKIGENYAMVITNSNGLWRYILGDTVRFTSIKPYKFHITGRTKMFINAFGEEVIEDNTNRALKKACEETGASVKEYTVAPHFMDSSKSSGIHKGWHEWVIEFEKEPADAEVFANLLDQALIEANSDYEAKRVDTHALERLQLHVASAGTFERWMKSRGRLGGQNKVPRLWNNRDHIESLLPFL